MLVPSSIDDAVTTKRFVTSIKSISAHSLVVLSQEQIPNQHRIQNHG